MQQRVQRRWRGRRPCPACAARCRPAAAAVRARSQRRLRRPPARGPAGRGRRCRSSGRRARFFDGGQSASCGSCASCVWMTCMPCARASASSRAQAGTMRCSGDTSLPSIAPKPPGSRKSRCMSISTHGGVRRVEREVVGCVRRHQRPPRVVHAVRVLCSVAGHRAADAADVGIGRRRIRSPTWPCDSTTMREASASISSRSSLTSSTPAPASRAARSRAWISALAWKSRPKQGLATISSARVCRRVRAPAPRAARCRRTGSRSARPAPAS